MTDIHRDRRLAQVPASIRDRVCALVRQYGPRVAARRLGVSKEAAIRVAAGLDVMPGTLALMRERLAGEGVAA